MIGKLSDLHSFAQEEFQSLESVRIDEGHVKMTLDWNELYYLDDLSLARSLDFRPNGLNIKGITLVLVSSANNWRNYIQWLGRVGRTETNATELEWLLRLKQTQT